MEYQDRLLPRQTVEEMTTLSTATLYRRVSDGTFPRPVKLGPNRVAWRLSEVQGWIQERQPSESLASG